MQGEGHHHGHRRFDDHSVLRRHPNSARLSVQVCLAFRNDGGTTVVVLCHKAKLQMEEQFEEIIPTEQRFGTRFVFRQVSGYACGVVSCRLVVGPHRPRDCPVNLLVETSD